MASPRTRRLEARLRNPDRRFAGSPVIRIMGPPAYRPKSIAFNTLKGIYVTPAGGDPRARHPFARNPSLPRIPRRAPQCRMLTPVFHPNFDDASVCIGDFWAASEGLDDLVVRIGRMIAYQEYNTRSPLNGLAAKWAAEHLNLLPIDGSIVAPPSEAASINEPSAAFNRGNSDAVATSCRSLDRKACQVLIARPERIELKGLRGRRRSFDRLHVDGDLKRVISTAQDQSVQRTDITVVAAPGQGYMAVCGDNVVGRVHVKPAAPGTVRRDPCVGCVGANQPRNSWRLIRAKIAADISRREIQRAETGNLQVREILAHAAPLAKDLLRRRPYGRHFRVETKVCVDARRQVEERLWHRTAGSEGLLRISRKLRPRPDSAATQMQTGMHPDR